MASFQSSNLLILIHLYKSGFILFYLEDSAEEDWKVKREVLLQKRVRVSLSLSLYNFGVYINWMSVQFIVLKLRGETSLKFSSQNASKSISERPIFGRNKA